MGDDEIRGVAERHLAKQRPINELIGVAVNATAWVGLSVFLIMAVWHIPKPNEGSVFQIFKYATTAVAAGSSVLAAYGLFMPIYRIGDELRRRRGVSGFFFAWLSSWVVSVAFIVWIIAVAFTFIGLAKSLYLPS